MNTLTDSLVLVTGAGSGIGRATALAFAREGARVLSADIDEAAAEKTAASCLESGAPEAHAFAIDVSDADAFVALAERVTREHGVVDVLVNNAGVGMTGRFTDMSLDDWRWIRSINLDGVVHGCHAFGPAMLERGRGHVVNVSSGLGYTPHATETAYVATKAAVLAFSQSLRADWHDNGVTVTAICPGVINTPIVDATRYVGDDEDSRRTTTRKLFRRGHSPDKVARAIVRSAKRSRAVVPVGIDSKLALLQHRFAPALFQERLARLDLGGKSAKMLASAVDGVAVKVPTDDGAVLSVVVSGDGPLVVLAHCWTGSSAMWDAVTRRLVRTGHRVVRYDQRGHGSSTVGADGLALERIGNDLRCVLEHLDAKDAVVAGHSLGGMAIQSLAITDPDVFRDRVRSVVLVATSARGIRSARLGRVASQVVGSSSLARVMARKGGHLFVRSALGRSPRKDDVRSTRDHFVACPADSRATILTAMQSMDLRGLTKIEPPVIVVVGSRDRLTVPKLSREIASRLDAPLVELEGAGHMLPLERPDELAELISSAAGRSRPRADRATGATRPESVRTP